MAERTRLYDLARRFLKEYRKPLSRLTLGKEIEIIDHAHRRYDDPEMNYDVLRLIKYHEDWSKVYELVLPPIGFPPRPEDVLLYNAIEALAHTLGYRVSEYVGFNRYTCGSHLHFWHHDTRKLVKITNWVIFLGPLFVDLLSLPLIFDANEERLEVLGEMSWRTRVDYYAEPPRYINTLSIHELKSARRRFRGYERYHDNLFFAVEFNAWRKKNMTVEFRLPEQHWLADVIFMDVAQAISEKFDPPIIDMKRWYRQLYRLPPFEAVEIPILKRHQYFDRRYANRRELIKFIYEHVEHSLKFNISKKWFEDYLGGQGVFQYLYFFRLSVNFLEDDVPRYSKVPGHFYKMNRALYELLEDYYNSVLKKRYPPALDPYVEIPIQ